MNCLQLDGYLMPFELDLCFRQVAADLIVARPAHKGVGNTFAYFNTGLIVWVDVKESAHHCRGQLQRVQKRSDSTGGD